LAQKNPRCNFAVTDFENRVIGIRKAFHKLPKRNKLGIIWHEWGYWIDFILPKKELNKIIKGKLHSCVRADLLVFHFFKRRIRYEDRLQTI